MLLVDTNVLVDVLENDPDWADWSVRQLRAQSQVHDLSINRSFTRSCRWRSNP